MDNFYQNCPPVMSDGRLFMDYRSNMRANEYIKKLNNIVRDDDYRLFLQNNAEKILDENWKQTKLMLSSCRGECVHNYPTRMEPQWFSEERKKVNSLADPYRKTHYPCQTYKDYRATETKSQNN